MPKIFWRVLRRASQLQSCSAHQMCEVRTEVAIGHGSRDRVTVDASRRFEYSLPLGSGITGDCRLALLLNPASELILRLNVDTQQHLGVLRPGILSALTQVEPRLTQSIHMLFGCWEASQSACQTRNPRQP